MRVLIEQGISGTFYVSIIGHRANPKFKSILRSSQTSKEAYDLACVTRDAINSLHLVDEDVGISVSSNAKQSIDSHTKYMAFPETPLFKESKEDL